MEHVQKTNLFSEAVNHVSHLKYVYVMHKLIFILCDILFEFFSSSLHSYCQYSITHLVWEQL